MITPIQLNEPTPFRLLFSLNFDVMVDEFAIHQRSNDALPEELQRTGQTGGVPGMQ